MREQGIISTHEQDLYLYLLHRSNVLFWKNPFYQSTAVLCSVLSIDRNALTARRKRLKQLSLIDFKEGKSKNRPAEYKIIYLQSNGSDRTSFDFSSPQQKNAAPKKDKKTRTEGICFIAPTTEEVERYCRERSNTVDAQRFVDFYTAKGWMLGKNKMKDWKAAIRTWEKDNKRIAHPVTDYKRNNRTRDERF